MEFKGFMGGLYRVSEWIMRLSVINIVWIVCSFPIVFLLLGILNTPAEQFNDMLTASLVWMAILAPFILFPATAAMFAVARKWVTGDEDVPLFKTYFRAYKENYVQSLIGGLLFVLLIVILVVNYRFYQGQEGWIQSLSVLFLILGVFAITATMNFFSILAHLHMNVLQIFKNAFLLSIASPLNSLTLIAGNAIVIWFSLFKFTFLIPFFMGTLCATLSFWIFYRSFQRIQERQEQLAEQQKQEEEQRQLEEKNQLAE